MLVVLLLTLLPMNLACDDVIRGAANFLGNVSDGLDGFADGYNDDDDDGWLEDAWEDVEDWF